MTGKNKKQELKSQMPEPESCSRANKREEKKELIMRAASHVFSEKGFHQATVEEIAREAGVGKGTIYQYFESKTHIFNELHLWYAGKYVKSMSDVLADELSFEENMRRLIATHVDNMGEMARFAQKMMNETEQMERLDSQDNKKTGLMAVSQVTKQLRTVAERAIARGEVRPLNPDMLVHFIIGLFFGVIHSVISDGQVSDTQSIKEELISIIMHGVEAQDNGTVS